MNTNQHNHHPQHAMVPPPTDMAGFGVVLNEIRTHVSSIAVLHERQTNSEQRLADSERRTTEALTDIKQQLLRVHDRLDLMDTNVREEVQSVREEFRRASEQHREETARQIERAVAPVQTKADDAVKVAKEVKADLDGWINRVRGGWSVGSIVFGVLQSAVVALVLWMGTEVKTMHDWRIQMEARQPDTRNDKQRGAEISAK